LAKESQLLSSEEICRTVIGLDPHVNEDVYLVLPSTPELINYFSADSRWVENYVRLKSFVS